MYAHCVYCPMNYSDDSVDAVEDWATTHEKLGGPKHCVKVEGYEVPNEPV